MRSPGHLKHDLKCTFVDPQSSGGIVFGLYQPTGPLASRAPLPSSVVIPMRPWALGAPLDLPASSGSLGRERYFESPVKWACDSEDLRPGVRVLDSGRELNVTCT